MRVWTVDDNNNNNNNNNNGQSWTRSQKPVTSFS